MADQKQDSGFLAALIEKLRSAALPTPAPRKPTPPMLGGGQVRQAAEALAPKNRRASLDAAIAEAGG